MQGKEFDGNEVVIMTCSNCNTHCKHCYISYSGNFDDDYLYNLCQNFSKRYTVLLNGTEILLHPGYFKSIELVRQDFILTNGIQLCADPSLIDRLSQIGIKHVGMSYHFGIHEDISSVNPKNIEDNIPRLKASGITTDIRVTITRNNIELIPEMCEKTLALGANCIKFTNYINVGSATNLSSENILQPKDLMIFFDVLEQERRKYPKDILKIERCGSFGNDCTRKCNFKCLAFKDSVTITPNLNVYPCIFLAKPGFEIGKVIDGKIIIYKDIKTDGLSCMAKEVLNNGLKIL